MCRSRLTHSALLGLPRLGAILLWAGLGMMVCTATSPAAAGPPKIGTSDSSWSDGLWSPFRDWKFPSFSSSPAASTKPKAAPTKAAEPGFTDAALTSIGRTWKSVQRSTRSAWESTKHSLRPYDPPPQPRSGSKQRRADRGRAESGGFWSSLFGGNSPPPRQATVNDFLRQPTPY